MVNKEQSDLNSRVLKCTKIPDILKNRLKFAFLIFTIYHVQGSVPAVLEWGIAVQQDLDFLGSMISKNPLT